MDGCVVQGSPEIDRLRPAQGCIGEREHPINISKLLLYQIMLLSQLPPCFDDLWLLGPFYKRKRVVNDTRRSKTKGAKIVSLIIEYVATTILHTHVGEGYAVVQSRGVSLSCPA